jgi:DNA polymerase III gamma/tau subunit
MLSKNAFNALLKTLEEPPSHVKFILATTEPEKVLPTILSRCQRYDFRNIGTREIAEHLKLICKKEKIDADEDALLLVAKAGAGSMRDSLSLLDRLLSVGEKNLNVEMIEQLLGMPRSQVIFDLVTAIGGGDVPAAISQADTIITNGLSVDSLIAALVDHLRNLLILRTCGPESKLVEVPGLPLSDLTKQAAAFDPAALSQDIVILEELRRHVRQSQAGRALLDATLVRMCLADQFTSIGELAALSGGNGSDAQKKKPVEVIGRGVESERPTSNVQRPTLNEGKHSAVGSSTLEVESSTFESSAQDDDDDLPAPGKVWEGPSLGAMMAAQSATSAVPQKKPELSNVEPIDPSDLPGQWRAMLALLAQQGSALHGMLSQGRFIGVEDGRAVIRVSKVHETFIKRLEQNGKKDIVREVVSTVLKEPVGVRFEVEEPAVATAAPARRANVAELPAARPAPITGPEPVNSTVRLSEEMRNKLYQTEPLVRAIVDQLGGTIIKLEE